MTKRKIIDDIIFIDNLPIKSTKKPKYSNPLLKLECSPHVNNIKDLISIGETLKFYKNIDSIMLWDILPYLKELDLMIGMNSLKETVFYQIIYYLQNMHYRNKNEEYLHTIITGNAGSGKTTIAKIIGKIYIAIVLSSNNNNKREGCKEEIGI